MIIKDGSILWQKEIAICNSNSYSLRAYMRKKGVGLWSRCVPWCSTAHWGVVSAKEVHDLRMDTRWPLMMCSAYRNKREGDRCTSPEANSGSTATLCKRPKAKGHWHKTLILLRHVDLRNAPSYIFAIFVFCWKKGWLLHGDKKQSVYFYACLQGHAKTYIHLNPLLWEKRKKDGRKTVKRARVTKTRKGSKLSSTSTSSRQRSWRKLKPGSCLRWLHGWRRSPLCNCAGWSRTKLFDTITRPLVTEAFLIHWLVGKLPTDASSFGKFTQSVLQNANSLYPNFSYFYSSR